MGANPRPRHLKAEWERRKELSDTVRAGATAHCVQIVTAARNFPITPGSEARTKPSSLLFDVGKG